ncbi:MAG: 4-alpha-glucanotransferase [Lachnospiraceae bacterium]
MTLHVEYDLLTEQRMAGVLVHPTSFPSAYGIGDLGGGAYQFVDFLVKSGLALWQVLPLGNTGFGDSPYQSFSSFAGQPLLISPDMLAGQGLLSYEEMPEKPDWDPLQVDYGSVIQYKTKVLHIAYEHFCEGEHDELKKQFRAFCRKTKWLSDYALFMALKDEHEGRPWIEWEKPYRFADAQERKKLSAVRKKETGYYKFIQFLFFQQWYRLKEYANERGIQIIGDIPIFVSGDSADVWTHKELFDLDSKGYPQTVAGVPPDYFSATGQLWGNPLYRWDEHKRTGYQWWIDRIQAQLQMTDYLRIDHFRGFETFWAVPYGEDTAINGKWKKGPGAELFRAIEAKLGENLPIIAEDLGIITPEVEALRDELGFPGMKVLQFAFDDLEENTHMPHTFPKNCVCYTGTHDNDTCVGWYEHAFEASKDKVRRYMNSDGMNISWDFIRTCFNSIAEIAIVPLQDVFSLDSSARMNTPGVPSGNWGWRYTREYLTDVLAARLYEAAAVGGRILKADTKEEVSVK